MTSNLGSNIILDKLAGANEDNRERLNREIENSILEMLRHTIRPEFLNRIDETIVFMPLSKTEIREIAKMQTEALVAKLRGMNVRLEFSNSALDLLAKLGYDPQFGARPMKRLLQKMVVNELSKQILAGNVSSENPIEVRAGDGDTVYFREKSRITKE